MGPPTAWGLPLAGIDLEPRLAAAVLIGLMLVAVFLGLFPNLVTGLAL